MTYVESTRRVQAANGVRAHATCVEPCEYDCPAHHPSPFATRDEIAAATVLAGVVYILGRDPQVRAMLDANDRDRFIEGCRSDPQFTRKFAQALLTIREQVTSTN